MEPQEPLGRRRPRPATPRRVTRPANDESSASEPASTPSLLSAANNPPPSYGTATRDLMRPLDAGQLAADANSLAPIVLAGGPHLAAGQAVGQWPHRLLLRDNNRLDQKQQQQLAAAGGQQLAPINHVISAPGSMGSQPQTNQYYWQPARLLHLGGALAQRPPAELERRRSASEEEPLGGGQVRRQLPARRRRRHRPKEAPDEPQQVRRQQQQQQPAISAHCWLIDSSDEQSVQQRLPGGPEHLTVAMMQQARRHHQQQQQQRKPPTTCHQIGSSHTLHSVPRRPNELLASRQPPARLKASRSCHALQSRSSSNLSRSSAGSPGCRPGGTATSGSLLRLGALLSMVTTLVRRAPRLPSGGDEQQARSVSGSLAPYAGGSLAVSSASSSSAYATGGSSQPSSQLAADPAPPISLSLLRAGPRPPSSLKTASWHAYEYCDAPELADGLPEGRGQSETRFVPEQAELSESAESARTEPAAALEEARQPVAASDHELISAQDGPPTRLANPAGRWCWLSVRGWLRRHQASGASPTGSQAERGPPQPLGGHAKASSDTRYKSLRSRGGAQAGSTLQNVVSLAKADRVFRWRLLASLLVTCLLLALLGLLGHMLHARRHSLLLYSMSGSNQARLSSLLIDDSDFDLSWLWPQSAPARGVPLRLEPAPSSAADADSPLRARLAAVERGNQLEQYQLAVGHLTSIQLATDAHLDLSQLAGPLLALEAAEQQANLSAKLGQRSLELASLLLLSNLNWPLVKWRHQNQQALANFFSFSLGPAAVQVGAGQPSSTRNLLALMLLTRDLADAQPDPHLAEFARLDLLLRSTANQIVLCSQLEPAGHLEANYCKQLLSRYRRMMACLASLNYSHLSRLHDSLELKQQQQQQQDRSAKTLLGFLLDRLALLEPQALAEAALASELFEGDQEPDLQLPASTLDPPAAPDDATDLFELTKRLVGEDPTQLNSNLFVARPQLEEVAASPDAISADLVYPWNSVHLPTFVTPLAYDLFMQPNLTSRQLVGMVKVSLKVERATRFLVLHASNLHLIELALWLKSGGGKGFEGVAGSSDNQTRQQAATLVPVAIRRVLSSPAMEQIYVELAHELEPKQQRPTGSSDRIQFGELPQVRPTEDNVYLLSVSFNKTSVDLGEPGLEFVQYTDLFAQPEAELKTLLYTQLEPAGARHLFPCFDEPHLRARFQLNLVHERHHQVLFNAAKRERVPYTADGLLQMSVFEATPIPISTYLVCLVVCDAHNIKSITSRLAHLQPASGLAPASQPSGFIQVQIMAQFEHLSQAEFASHLVPQLLAFYQTQLQFDYPLDKLDLLAIPSSASHFVGSKQQQQQLQWQTNELDTMENLGLIWFKAPLLLLDTNLISQDLIEQIAAMISHQLAHQYFGNIVSLARWQDRWLFEALCQYLEWSALSRVQADWRLEEQFVVATIQETLSHWTLEEADDINWPLLGPQQDGELENNEQPVEASEVSSSAGRPSGVELKRSSAILHMLLLNLLPSQEAQLRLLRNCLVNFQQRSMSSRLFWRQFGHQLALDGSMDRMHVDLSRFQPADSQATSSIEPDAADSSERVVFVSRRTGKQAAGRRRLADTAAAARNSGRLVDNLELVANQWLRRQAYPLVTATVYRDRVHLRQERFSAAWLFAGELDDELGAGESSLGLGPRERRHVSPAREPALDELWPIPLMFVSRANPRWSRFIWLDKRELELPLAELVGNGDSLRARLGSLQPPPPPPPPTGWLKLNVNQSSLVRVNYDDHNWEALGELLVKSHYSNHMLSQLDRANLIDDALSLMRSGRLSVGLAMNLTIYLEVGERDYMPWTSALRHLDQMQTLLNQNPLWHRYVLKLVQPISNVIGWKDDGPHLMRKLRRLLFSVALQYGDERTVSKARQEFKNWVRSNRFIVPNLQELAYVAGVRYGDQQEWFYCWQKYQQLVGSPLADPTANQSSELVEPKSASLPTSLANSGESAEPNAENEKRQLLTALASTQNTWLLEQFLNYSLDATKIQPRHLKHVVQTLGKNPVARLYLWRFVRLNWAALMDRHLLAPRAYRQILETMIHEATKHFATKLDLEEVKSFFDAKRKVQSSPQLEAAFRKSLQVIRFNIYWRDNIEPKLTKWLSNYNGATIN